MRPALAAVAERAREGAWPTVSEYAALLAESDTDPAEAASLTSAYANAIASITTSASRESDLLTALRSWRS